MKKEGERNEGGREVNRSPVTCCEHKITTALPRAVASAIKFLSPPL